MIVSMLEMMTVEVVPFVNVKLSFAGGSVLWMIKVHDVGLSWAAPVIGP